MKINWRTDDCQPISSMNDALRDEIIAEIGAAFANVQRGATTLHEADVIDHCGSEREQRAARARDTERRWQDVPDADMASNPSALSFLCPESFRYYIPAYMVWSLRHYRTSQPDSVIYALTPNTNKTKDKKKLAAFAMFSLQQREVIRRYLEFMVEHGDCHIDDTAASLALESYWKNANGA